MTDHRYIGLSADIAGRWTRHRYELKANRHVNDYLQNAYNKYGAAAFEYSVLEACSLQEMPVIEKKWVKHFNTSVREQGYNLDEGGSKATASLSAETRAKISATKQANPWVPSAETRRKWSQARTGSKLSEETRRKMSETAKNRSPEHLKKIADALRGRTLSEEMKARISTALTGRKASAEARENMRKAKQVSNTTPEFRAKISAARMGHAVTQETRDKIAKGHLGMKHSPDTLAKLSAAATGRWDSFPEEKKALIRAKRSASLRRAWAHRRATAW